MFRFANPEYLYLLVLIPLLIIIYAISTYYMRKRLRTYGDPRLLRGLMPLRSRVRPLMKFSLLLLALFLLIVMFARPQYGLSEASEKKRGIEAVVMVDVSNSMLATDIQPSRLERTKLLVSNLIDRMQNDQIALGVFAGEAYPQLPMTHDYASAKIFLGAVTTGMVTFQGTNLKAAIDLASSSFTDKDDVGKAIIIITDGEDHEGGAEEAAAKAAKAGCKVFILGVGTNEGAKIPVGMDYLKDEEGAPVISRLNEVMCQAVAAAGDGLYLHVDNTNSAQQQLQSALNNMEKSTTEVTYSAYDEQFQTIGIIILLLLIVEWLLFDGVNPWFRRIHFFSRKEKTEA